MTKDGALALVVAATEQWAADPESDVVWAGEYDGRRGIRMAQACRDFTTVWFDVGERTVGFEAYVLPRPPHADAEFYRHCMVRNWRSWPAHLATDDRGDLFVIGRIPLSDLNEATLDGAVGAIYQTIELSFRPLLRLGFQHREKSN
ncbi:MAG TPA: YbjN domain-containing protein [Acidimicrobiia bacterium]|jgi:hypothetical protein|nr:YbjN domain-containing protein [Acidimicrobiia bacterium]